ncbi:VacJ family lipoprotein [Gymnodinialimonas sp. 2305UL16-5]
MANDPYEQQNRAAHELNVALDQAIVGPSSEAYGGAVPEPVRQGVSNFASNLNQPSYVVNNLLQFRLGEAARNTLRFAVNTTVGIGGLFDPASAIGLPAESTDFGETLHIYGVPEGNYAVIPVLGPTTDRDTVGRVVDFALNPLRHVVETPESYYVASAGALSGLNSRYRFDGTIDGVLYESADSYAQLRSLYLQQRRFELGGGRTDAGGFGLEDPSADPETATAPAPTAIEDPSFDPYSDPYFDPYAQ